MHRPYIALSFVAVMALCACGGDAAAPPELAQITVSLGATTLGVNQTSQATATLVGTDGSVFVPAGDVVSWSSGSPSIATVSSTGLVTGIAPGSATISASLLGKSGDALLQVQSRAKGLSVATQPSGAAGAGTAFAQQPAVRLVDGAASVVSEAGMTVTATIAGGGGTLLGTTTAVTNASGVATFSNLAIGGVAGTRTLSFTATGLAGTTSSPVVISAGAPGALALVTAPSTVAASGDPIPVQPAVQLQDAFGNSVGQAGVVITAAVDTGAGVLSGNPSGTTDATGKVTFALLSISGDGPHVLRFTAPGLSAVRSGRIAVAGLLRNITFEAYSSTTGLLADCTNWDCVEQKATSDAGVPGFAAGDITLDLSVSPPGLTKAMRYHYLHPGNGCNSITLERAFKLPAKRQEAWAEFQVRWSTNFTTENPLCQPNDHKLIFGDTEADQSGRWAFYVGSDVTVRHTIRQEIPWGGIAPATYGFKGNTYMNLNPAGPNELLAFNMWDGNWHTIRLHMKQSTTFTSNDGVWQVWVDGVLKHDERGFSTGRNDGSTNPDFLTGYSFAHNKDDGPAGVDMYIWWGRIRVFGANPGW